MAEYKKYGRPGGAPQRSFGGQNAQSRELFNAECNKCGGRCQVPFRPNGKKPVYCSNCFVKDESRPATNSFERREYKPRTAMRSAPVTEVPDRQIQDLKRQIEVMNETLERLAAAVGTLNNAAALSDEVRKYVPEKKPVVKIAKKAAAKTSKK